MPKNDQFATPDALASAVQEKYPEYAKVPKIDLAKKVLEKYPEYWGHVDKTTFNAAGIAQSATSANGQTGQQHEQPKPAYNYGSAKAYDPSWWERTKNVFRAGAGEGAEDAAQAGSGGSKLEQLRAFANHPLAAFEQMFSPNPDTAMGRYARGAAKAASGMTSPFQLATMAVPATKLKTVGEVMHAVGSAMLPTVLTGTADSIKQIKAAKESGDVQAEDQAWGEMAGNLAMIVVPHGIGMATERIGHSELNVESQDRYKQPFRKLTDEQKTNVLYSAAEKANPKLAERVEKEFQRINSKKVPGEGGRTVAEVRQANADDAVKESQEQAARREAFNAIISQELQRARQAEAHKQNQLKTEQNIRSQREAQLSAQREAVAAKARADAERARVEGKSVAEQRGFTVDDQRHTQLGLQRENDLAARAAAPSAPPPDTAEGKIAPERVQEKLDAYRERNPGAQIDAPPTAPADRTPVRVQRASELERPVQEFAEKQHGASFSSLPLAQQEEVASHFMRNEPEKWDAFKGTQAFDAYRRHADAVDNATPAMTRWAQRGNATGDELSPDADVMSGVARVVSARTDVDATLKSKPETYQAINQYAEHTYGKSYDSLDPEQKPTALAGFLRTNPDQVGNFVTPEIAGAIQDGQHIDLANMEANLADRQQVQMLMAHREATRAAMDHEISGVAVDEARANLREQTRRIVRLSPSMETEAGNRIAEAASGITRLADRITIDGVKASGDLFHVERAIRQIPERDRSSDMGEFLRQMRNMRLEAEGQALREYREELVRQLRSDAPAARERAAREVVNFEDQRHVMNRMADAMDGEFSTPEQKADAAELRETSDFLHRQEDAVVAAVEEQRSGRPAREVNSKMPVSLGRETRVKLNSGEEVPVHYAVVSADDLITSHQSTNNYQVDQRFPQSAQPRDYLNEPELQTAVEQRANNLDAGDLLAENVRPIEGPPVVLPDGVVLSGNGRTQSIKLAQKRGVYDRVYAALVQRAEQFGIDKTAVVGVKNPVLVRLMDRNVTDTSDLVRYGLEMNRDSSQGMSSAEQSAALSRLLTPSVVERMAGIFSSVSGDASLRSAMRLRARDIGDVLRDAGIVDETKRAAYFTEDGDLTERAKELVEDALAGLTVTNPNTIRRASNSVKDKLGRVGMDFVKMRSAGEEWNLASYNTDAAELLHRAEEQSTYLRRMEGRDVTGDAGHGSESLIERMLHPERYRLSNLEIGFDGQSTHAPVHPAVEAMAMLMEESPRQYAGGVGDYADAAIQGGATMFGAMHPADVFTDKIASRYGLRVIPEEWGMVGGLPDSVKAEIEESRGPMPVEPSVHAENVVADVQPDPAPAVDAMKTRDVRNVSELRRKLANMPNITEEQAQALSDFAEHVLPRAMGESLNDLLGNYRLRFMFGGKEGGARGYTEFVNDSQAVIRLMDSADPSTFLHETAHFLRKMLSSSDQEVVNEFVGARHGEEWSTEQEEKFAQAFERYHWDGGRRRGKLDKVFAVLHKAMQSVYDMARGMGLAKGTDKLNAMFDNWYDWTRKERQPITERNDLAKIEEATKGGTVTIPEDAEMIDGTPRLERGARAFVFSNEREANDFIDRNSKVIRTYQIYKAPGSDATYVKANAVGKRLYQAAVGSVSELARQARDIEERLKSVTDPREEAALRAKLNGIDNKLGTSTFVFGRQPLGGERSTVDLAYGISEMPHLSEPTTPAQAAMVRQVYADPSEFEVGGRNGRTEPELRNVPDETAREAESDRVAELPEPTGASDGRDEATGRVVQGRGGTRRGGAEALARPESNPLAKMPAATLKMPSRPRGTPVVDADAWRGYADALGLPQGTPPPTVRLPEDLREMMIYPGQPEAIEVALSGLQQYDAVVVAAPTGSGKTYMSLAIADQLLGTEGNKVGLIITRARNLISDSDGYIDVGNRLGVTVEHLPNDLSDIQGGGVYADTYAGTRGDKDILGIPWDFVIFDESAEGRNWMDSEQGKSVVALGHAAKKAVYVSATPFHTAVETGYMHKLGLWPEGGFFEWARQFGVVETGPNSYTGGYAPKKLMKLRQQLIERGQWVSLDRDLDGVSAHVGMVPQTEEVKNNIKKIREVFSMASRIFKEQGKSSMARAAQAQEVIYLKRYIESARLSHALDLAEQSVKEGWNPIIYSEYRSGSDEGMKFFKNLPAGMDTHLNAMLPPLPDVVAAVRERLGENVSIFAGQANELRSEEREQFMRGQKRAAYATYAAGGVGVSFHDKFGDRPRRGIYLGLPWSGIMFEQSLGRTWRYGVRSDVSNVFLTSDTLPEMKVLATKILPRMRALNAAVYGEVNETALAKQLRESVGLAEEAIDYEMGNEAAPEAAQFEHTPTDHGFTRLEDLDLPKASAAKNRGMKYREQPRRLYQGPADDLFSRDAQPIAEGVFKDLPTFAQRPFRSSFAQIHADIVNEGKQAFMAGEPVKPAMERAARDAKIGLNLALQERALIALHGAKKNMEAVKNFAKEWVYLRHTAGEQTIRKMMADAGYANEGREVQRRLIERSHLKANFQGDLLARVADVLGTIKDPRQHEQVVRVVEGKAQSSDPAINEAAQKYRDFFAHVRRTLADAGASMKFYGEDGKEVVLPYSKIQDDPNYWPHVYDWNKPLLLNGEVTTLGELHDMPSTDERRASLIKAYANKRGISVLDADRFFSKNRRGVRLAGNLEKGRRANIPDYDTTQRALSVYVNQVSDMLANLHSIGQEREKINPLIYQLPLDTQRVVNSVVTADLNPQSIGEGNKRALRLASQWTVLSKMGLSALKLPFHMAKSSLVTNTRSLVGGLLGLATSPKEMVGMARDAGVLTDYVREAMMMEYGLHSGGLDQKMLTATGFTLGVYLSRVTAAASGRVFLERYAVPELQKNPEDQALRRKLKDLYAFSDDDLSRMAQKGYNVDDVKRAMVAAADWTTGSGRPSELPPVVRYVEDHPISKHFNSLMRLTWQLKTFEFKTANLVNRTVFEGLKEGGIKGWSNKEYKAVGRWLVSFGAAGLGLRMMQVGVQSIANPEAAEEEKRRLRDSLHDPKSALFMELGNVSYGMGIYPLKVLFDRLGTNDPKDLKKMQQQHRLQNAVERSTGGILAEDFDHAVRGLIDWVETFGDDGVKHQKSGSERRSDIIKRVMQQEFAPLRLLKGAANAVSGSDKPVGGTDGLVLKRRARKPRQTVLR